jgi:hypothetical protein
MSKTRAGTRPECGEPPSRTPRPATRRMTIVAQDPSVKRTGGGILMATVDVPAEELVPGPMGYRVQVVDYDATSGEYHGRHVLPRTYDDEPTSWRKGRLAILKDYRFHAQNVYALVMMTLARFEFALGRRIGWAFETHQLKVAPHGIVDANAFYSREVEGLVLGCFQGLRGRKVFTALSHDIVVHETTHALIDALRVRYLDPSGPDQAGFHEGFADIVALLSVFAQVEVVREMLRRSAGVSRMSDAIPAAALTPVKLRKGPFTALAKELGKELQVARGEALRRSAELKPSPAWLTSDEFKEPHRRGEILVAAVINAFIETWSRRLTKALVPGQDAHQVWRVAEEGADIASMLLTMWIRALDYMPPVHVEFGDTLSAALTADLEVRPDDSRLDLRDNLLASFKAYGIKPTSSRKDLPGIWEPAPVHLKYDRIRFESMKTDHDEVFRFLWENRDVLGIPTEAYTKVLSVRPCRRIGEDGFVLHETVAEYYQVARLTEEECRKRDIGLPEDYVSALRSQKQQTAERRRALAGAADDAEPDSSDESIGAVTAVYGGGVLVFNEFGRLKYHVRNDVFSSRQTDRLHYLWEAGLLRTGDRESPIAATRISTIHRQRALGARRFSEQGW